LKHAKHTKKTPIYCNKKQFIHQGERRKKINSDHKTVDDDDNNGGEKRDNMGVFDFLADEIRRKPRAMAIFLTALVAGYFVLILVMVCVLLF
jgi:hypothetical protein